MRKIKYLGLLNERELFEKTLLTQSRREYERGRYEGEALGFEKRNQQLALQIVKEKVPDLIIIRYTEISLEQLEELKAFSQSNYVYLGDEKK